MRADVKVPMVRSRGTEGVSVQKSGGRPKGSSRTQLLKEAIKLIGNVPLHEAAEHYTIEAWRVWNSEYARDYNESSKEFLERLNIFKRNAELARAWNAERECVALNNSADLVPWDEMRSSLLPEPYPGTIPEECLAETIY